MQPGEIALAIIYSTTSDGQRTKVTKATTKSAIPSEAVNKLNNP
jgi:hypothetical protein